MLWVADTKFGTCLTLQVYSNFIVSRLKGQVQPNYTILLQENAVNLWVKFEISNSLTLLCGTWLKSGLIEYSRFWNEN